MKRYPFYEDLFTEGEGQFMRIAMKYKFYYIDEPLAVMRTHDWNMRFVSKRNAEVAKVQMDKLAKHPDFPKEYILDFQALYSQMFRECGWREVRLGSNTEFARKMFSESIKYDWKQIFRISILIGWPLSFFPKKLRNYVNWLMNLILKQEKTPYLEDY